MVLSPLLGLSRQLGDPVENLPGSLDLWLSLSFQVDRRAMFRIFANDAKINMQARFLGFKAHESLC